MAHPSAALLVELSALQDAILEGQRPQYKLPAAAIARLSSLKRGVAHDDGQRKRQRIESAIQGARPDKNERIQLIDVDSILTKAQQLVPPVSGLKAESFDENDYYSSQVESKWSEDEFERVKKPTKVSDISDDEYIPDEPKELSDYEPGEVSHSDEYSPGLEPRVKVSHLTELAAPQPNRVSPLTTYKSYELELVNGRPEMVRKYDTDVRQSSASPPARQKRKAKKRKRDEPTPQLRQPKKRHRDAGLDDSAQYPQLRKPERSVSAVQPLQQREDLRRVATLHARPGYATGGSFVTGGDAARPFITGDIAARPFITGDIAARPFNVLGDGAARPFHTAGDGAARPLFTAGDGAARPFHTGGDMAARPLFTAGDAAARPFITAGDAAARPFVTPGDGLRYYPIDPIPHDRAPSAQYDPNNARMDYMQSVRPVPATPAYQKREYEPPVYRPVDYYRQESVAPNQFYRPEQRMYDPQAYGAVREGLQVLPYPQPMPVQYALPPDPHVRYIDARGFELPPHMRPAADRPY